MDAYEEINLVLDRIESLVGPGLDHTKNLEHANKISRNLITAYGQLYELCSQNDVLISEVSMEGSMEDVCDSILAAIRPLGMRASFVAGRKEAAKSLQENYVKLTIAEIEAIEDHIKEARSKIRKSDAFDEKHKQRLMKRLETLQTEIHKKISDKDVFLAGVTEVTAAAGKSAENLNPVVDLFRKIFQITDERSSNPLQLPAPPRQIENKSGDE